MAKQLLKLGDQPDLMAGVLMSLEQGVGLERLASSLNMTPETLAGEVEIARRGDLPYRASISDKWGSGFVGACLKDKEAIDRWYAGEDEETTEH